VGREIAKGAIEKVNDGLAKFHPPHWINSYNAWMRELKDWCISRQLWWGHRIPVFYCDDCGHEWADEDENPAKCPKCGSAHFHQDPDVLDTWFSSGLWPFSTLGWGNADAGRGTLWQESDLRDFYPNSLLITGFDILFFWVARMMFSGEHFVGELPFKDIYLHALVRDEHGAKMSKSKGNVIDPLEMIEEFSTDALRFTLAALAVQGRDIRLSRDKMEQMRNFTNKLFNAAKFLLMNESKFADLDEIEIKTELGRYIASRFECAVKETRDYLDAYRFNDAATTLYRFLWNEFCDWGIELAKAQKEAIAELGAVFKEAMKLMHPFMPFLSEYLYQQLSATELESSESIMIKRFPIAKPQDEAIEQSFALIIEAIVGIRRAKATLDIAGTIPSAAIKCDYAIDEKFAPFIKLLAKCENIAFVSAAPEGAVRDVCDHLEVFVPLDNVDLTPIIARLEAQKAKLEKEIAKLDGMLSNERFVANAPASVIAQNRAGLDEARAKHAKVAEELASLGGAHS
jgi:valyl-tRNA synthetase